ncbi:cytochrome b561 and DOMON domain-containing protein At2g04850 [Typha latifolia]|uniref:cytochrome b561 and DOMON domain-containing protein At2g04850 n=1 Tax=Typha latifolia TaxID=4733 RepID=UPI003C2F1D11
MPFFFFLLLLLLPLLSLLLASASAAAGGGGTGSCTTITPLKTYQKCISLPSQGASLAWTYHPHNATLDLAFSSTFISPSGWVAWGINPDAAAMTGTRALIAFSDPSSGGLLLLPFILNPSVKLQSSPLTSRPLDIPLLSSSAILHATRYIDKGAAVQIFATVKLSPNRTRIHHVWNRGLYVQGYAPTIHPTTPSDLSSLATIDVVSTATEMVPTVSNIIRSTHAILNAIAWGFLLPLGVAVARYLRPCTSVGPTWFYAHAAVQIAGFFLGAAGFGIGIVMGNASKGVTYGLHRGLGLAAFVAGGTQSAALLFRPKTTNRFRKYWKSYHHFVGYGCVVLGVVNVFQGFEVMGLGQSYWKLGYCLALSTLIGVCVALEVNAWVVFFRRQEEEKVRKGGGGGVEGIDQVVKGRMSFN